jgi:holo-[acyl-carrier protein] synthase
MILGIGTDLVDIARIEAALEKSDALAKRVLTEFEWEEFESSKQPARFLAKKFASKEATAKAIGTGIGNGISWQHIEIAHDKFGKPMLNPLGAFQDWCEAHRANNLQISITDEKDYASAFVIIESVAHEQIQ